MIALIVSSKQNSYTTKDGELRQIASLTMLQPFPEHEDGKYGLDTFEVTIPYVDKDNHKHVPAFYDVDLGMSHSYGKIVPIFQKLKFLQSVNIAPPVPKTSDKVA